MISHGMRDLITHVIFIGSGLRKKIQVSKCVHGILLPTWVKLSSEGPVTLLWGPIKLVSQESVGKKKDEE